MIGAIVYILCTIASMVTAFMLLKYYSRTRVRFLFWSGLCFAGLALGNLLLFIDTNLWPYNDLSTIRLIPAVIGYGVLIYGIIWDVI
jgi:hypothetical protein